MLFHRLDLQRSSIGTQRLPENHECFGIAIYPKWQTRYHSSETKNKRKGKKKIIEHTHFAEPKAESRIQRKFRFPLGKTIAVIALILVTTFVLIIPIYSTHQLSIRVLDADADIQQPWWYEDYGVNLDFKLRFSNIGSFDLLIRNVKLKTRSLDVEKNEQITPFYGEIPLDLIPEIGKGLTIYSNSFRQYHILSFAYFSSSDYESLSIIVEVDVSNLWYTRHFTHEVQIVG